MAQETILVGISLNIPLFAITSVILFIFILALCACREIKNPSAVPGIDYLSDPTIVTTQPSLNKLCGNGTLPAANNILENGDGNSKLKVPTLQRKLPDIPVLPVPLIQDALENASDSQSPDTGSELYATVDANGPQSSTQQQHNREKPLETSPPEQIQEDQLVTHPVGSTHHESVLETLGLAASDSKFSQEPITSSGDSDAEHPYSHVQSHNYMRVKREHPYDWLKGQGSEERDTDTDNYDDPHSYTQSHNAVAFRDWLPVDHSNFEPPPPPVPEKRFDLTSDGSVDDQLHQLSTLTAANAVSGWVSATDIPYVTSPLDSPTNQQSPVNDVPPPIVPEPVYNGSQDSTASGPDIRYTSISVREPLANLRTHPRVQQPESYYSVVSDDEIDQTYAEIHSGQASDTGSILYAAVDPVTNQHRELPPVPPPVESLRSLRTNHSRQASTSSIVSGSFLTTPTDTSVPTSTPATSSTDIASNFVNTETKESSYTGEKPRLADRRTIHVTETQNFMQLSNVEDMYAKVLKNKRLSLHHDAYLNENSSSSSSFSSKGTKTLSPPPHHSFPSNEILPDDEIMLRPRNFTADNRPKSMIAFANYDKIDETNLLSSSSAQNVFSFTPCDESSQNESSLFNHDPGYESIREKRNNNSDPGYEVIFGNDTNDPGYETVLLANNNNSADPGYEAVILSSINLESSEPGYETVNIHTVNQLDPDYETINLFQLDHPDPGYEQIRNNYEESEPGYESIVLKKEIEGDDYEETNFRNLSSDHSNDAGNFITNILLEEQSPIKSFNSLTTEENEDLFNDPGYEKVKFFPIHDVHSVRKDDSVKNDNCTASAINGQSAWNGNDSKNEVPAVLEEETHNHLNKNSEGTTNKPSIDLVGKISSTTVEPDYATVNKNSNNDATELVSNDNFLTPHQMNPAKSLDNENQEVL